MRECLYVWLPQSAAAFRAIKAGPSAPPSAMSNALATQNKGECKMVLRQVVVKPRLDIIYYIL